MDRTEQEQADIKTVLDLDALFATVTVDLEDKGDIESEIDKGLGTLNTKAGKMGAYALVLEPEETPTNPDTPSPELRIQFGVQVFETQLFNNGADGTGKSVFQLTRRIRQLLHRRSLGRGVLVWKSTSPAPQSDPSRRSRVVTFERLDQEDADVRVGTPLIDPDEGAAGASITLTCATSGAAIYYTTDGSYPCSTNAEATLYAAPFAAVAGTLKAAAEKSGLQPSSVAEAEFS